MYLAGLRAASGKPVLGSGLAGPSSYDDLSLTIRPVLCTIHLPQASQYRQDSRVPIGATQLEGALRRGRLVGSSSRGGDGAPSHEQVDPDPRYGSPSVSETSQSQRYGSPDPRYGDSDSEIRGRKVRDTALQARDTGAQSPRHGGSESEIRVSRPETRGLRLRDTGAQAQRHGGADSETRGRRLRVRGRRA